MKKRRFLPACAAAAVGALLTVGPQTIAASAAPPRLPALPVPKTVLLDGPAIARIRSEVSGGHATAAEQAAVAALVRTADSELTAGPWSVTDKTQIPPSGDKHDYMSQAPYWWPTQPSTPDNPLGCPYVQKDGQRYPGADAIPDHDERWLAWNAIHDLTLAWYYTGRSDFAQRAELDARTWFTNPATAMNPNLAYAQGIPCQAPGRGTGIIESSDEIVDVLDAFALLDSGAPGWTRTDRTHLRTWLSAYLTWMLTSSNGKDEEAATNNHGSWKDQQDAAIALYVGQRSQAAAIAQSAEAKRIAVQIKSDGSQPLELSRTRSWHYSNFNATALCRLAEVGRHVGVDLWSYTAPDGGSLAKAVNYLIPAAENGSSAWPHEELGTFDQTLAVYELHAAAAEAHDPAAKAALGHVPAPGGTDLWPIEPDCLATSSAG